MTLLHYSTSTDHSRNSHRFENLGTVNLGGGAILTSCVVRFCLSHSCSSPTLGQNHQDLSVSVYLFDANLDTAPKPDLAKAIKRLSVMAAPAAKTEYAFHLEDGLPESIRIVFYANKTIKGDFLLSDFQIITAERRVTLTKPEKSSQISPYWSETDLRPSWEQRGTSLIVHWLDHSFYATMPSGWQLSDVDASRLEAAGLLLFDACAFTVFGTSRKFLDPKFREFSDTVIAPKDRTGNILLSYSTGEDSTAALAVLPEKRTIPFHSRRDYESYRRSDGHVISLGARDREQAALNRVPNCIIIPNTFEKIALSVGMRHGYSDNFGYAAIGLLLANHVQAEVIAFGSVMEQVYMRSGNTFIDIFNYVPSRYNRYRELFEYADIFYALPTGFISEIVTSHICKAVKGRYITVPCPNTDSNGKPCGTCFKCFRKLRMEGASAPPPSPEVTNLLGKRPLKSGTSVMRAVQNSGDTIPALSEYAHIDFSVVDRYLSSGTDHLLMPTLASEVRARLEAFGIKAMSSADELLLKDIGRCLDPDAYDLRKAEPLHRRT